MFESIIAAIVAFTSPVVATTAETTFADDARACHEQRETYMESRACMETIWKDRDSSMRHCANDEDAETNCIWEGTNTSWRYVDVDGIAYYIRLDYATMNV